MSEAKATGTRRVRRIRHTGRGSQVLIYLGKQFRFFINESDWKVLPMAAVIAGLVSMVIRSQFFVTMEGDLIGAFALTCVAIWNGCFNSIQAICRERAIIKREHRSGLHISSYVTAHMIYQFLLCLAQTVLTLFVLRTLGVPIPAEGFLTKWMLLDLGITMLLISYAADMMSLFLSSIARTTTGAMTLMPFILIFQLVFSGGVIPLPAWTQAISPLTISNYGIKAIAAQSNYNELPMAAVWKTLAEMKDNKIEVKLTMGQILDTLNNQVLEKYRDTEVLRSYTVGEISQIVSASDQYLQLREKKVTQPVTMREILSFIVADDSMKAVKDIVLIPDIAGNGSVTLGSLLTAILNNQDMASALDRQMGRTITVGEVLDSLHAEELAASAADVKTEPVTLGEIADLLKNNSELQKRREDTVLALQDLTVGDVIDFFGEENVKELVQRKTAEAAYKPEYKRSIRNIVNNWLSLAAFILFFALISTITLELIDKDKR